MKITLRLLGILGTVIFGLAFLVTFSVPTFVEDAGKTFIQYHVEKEVRSKINAIQTGRIEVSGILGKSIRTKLFT